MLQDRLIIIEAQKQEGPQMRSRLKNIETNAETRDCAQNLEATVVTDKSPKGVLLNLSVAAHVSSTLQPPQICTGNLLHVVTFIGYLVFTRYL